MRRRRPDHLPVDAGQRGTILGDAPLLHPRQMIIAREGRAVGRVRPAGIGHCLTVEISGQPCQQGGVLHRGPAFRAHVGLLARLAVPACQPPVFHLGDIVGIDPLKAAMRRNHRLDEKLRTATAGNLGLGRRLAGLVIEDGKPATGKPVDPVGPRAECHLAGRCRQPDAAIDLGMAFLDTGAAPVFGLDEPGCDGFEGGPPEVANRRVLPMRIEHSARKRA